MRFSLPKDKKNMLWTNHVKRKMQYYGLSEKRLKRVLRNPIRVEKGIAPNTLAVMQSTGTKKHPTEIWLMYQTINEKRPPRARLAKGGKAKNTKLKRIRIISAWRYPGISPKREPPPIPEDILKELNTLISQ